MVLFILFFNTFIYFFGCTGSHCCSGFSLVAVNRGCFLVVVCGGLSLCSVAGSSLWWLLLLWARAGVHGSVVATLGPRAAGSICVAHRPGAPQHVGASQTRNQTCVSYAGRWILYHESPRKPLDCTPSKSYARKKKFSSYSLRFSGWVCEIS